MSTGIEWVQIVHTGTKVKYQDEEYIVLESNLNVNSLGFTDYWLEIAQTDENGELLDGTDKTVRMGHISII